MTQKRKYAIRVSTSFVITPPTIGCSPLHRLSYVEKLKISKTSLLLSTHISMKYIIYINYIILIILSSRRQKKQPLRMALTVETDMSGTRFFKNNLSLTVQNNNAGVTYEYYIIFIYGNTSFSKISYRLTRNDSYQSFN